MEDKRREKTTGGTGQEILCSFDWRNLRLEGTNSGRSTQVGYPLKTSSLRSLQFRKIREVKEGRSSVEPPQTEGDGSGVGGHSKNNTRPLCYFEEGERESQNSSLRKGTNHQERTK